MTRWEACASIESLYAGVQLQSTMAINSGVSTLIHFGSLVGPVNTDQFSIVARASLSQNYDGLVCMFPEETQGRNGPFDHVVTFHRA